MKGVWHDPHLDSAHPEGGSSCDGGCVVSHHRDEYWGLKGIAWNQPNATFTHGAAFTPHCPYCKVLGVEHEVGCGDAGDPNPLCGCS